MEPLIRGERIGSRYKSGGNRWLFREKVTQGSRQLQVQKTEAQINGKLWESNFSSRLREQRLDSIVVGVMSQRGHDTRRG
jgi:hypothetical protein